MVVDCEVAFNFLRGHYPLHGPIHTMVVASPLGLLSGLFAVRAVRRWFPRTVAAYPLLRGDLTPAAGAIGGLLGGATHPLLDAIGRNRTYPFWPWSKANPLFHVMPYWELATLCVLTGLLGYWILKARTPAATSF